MTDSGSLSNTLLEHADEESIGKLENNEQELDDDDDDEGDDDEVEEVKEGPADGQADRIGY